MKTVLEEGFIGVDMPPLPDDIWRGVRLLQLTEIDSPAYTTSTTSETLTAWLSPPQEAVTTSGTSARYGIICGNNPVNFVDPWGLDPAETGFMGASQTMGGYLDGLLFGVLPDQDNANYRAGQTVGDVVSLAGGLARLGYAGAAKGSSLLLQKAPTLANAMKAVARRNTLKKVFRLNPWSKYRIYPFDKIYANPKYHGDLLEIIKASGRTNPYLNLLGAGMAGSALYDLLDEDESTPSSDECK